MEGTSSQGPSDGAGGANLSRHQARLQAAAMAASLYEKSFSYLPASSFWYASTNQLKASGIMCLPSIRIYAILDRIFCSSTSIKQS